MTAVVGVALAVGCASGSRFTRELPGDLPDVRGWEKKVGRVPCVNPAGHIDYELFVSPARPMVYSVTRYRATLDTKRTPENDKLQWEKLQWDKDGRDVRRYECRPTAAENEPCRWHEFPRGSAEYDAELGALIAVFFGTAPDLIKRTPPSPSPSPSPGR